MSAIAAAVRPVDDDDVEIRRAEPTWGATSGRLLVLFDRDCGLCTATANRLRRWDRRAALELVPLQDVAGRGPLVRAAVARRPLGDALHVVDLGTGEVRSGGRAALAIVARLPGGRIPARLAAVPPVAWLVERAYRVVARNRRRIGRWLRLEGPVCAVPR
jgi:predicted DCC family thiol-disulfide oxidoreductase YuxK